MTKKHLKTLQEIPVYLEPHYRAKEIDQLKLQPNQIIPYNREKRRDEHDWIEIYLEDGRFAYIEKNKDTYVLLKRVLLKDTIAMGFSYTLKSGVILDDKEPLFFPNKYKGFITGDVQEVDLESGSKDNKLAITLQYDQNKVEVERFYFERGDAFYVIDENPSLGNIFVEVDNFEGIRGFIFKNTTVEEESDRTATVLAILITIVLVIIGMTVLTSLNGSIRLRGGMVTVIFGIATVLVFILRMVFKLFGGTLEQVRKRM